MKKILSISFMLVLSLFLVSCGEEKVEDNQLGNQETGEITDISERELDDMEKIGEEMRNDIKDISDKIESGEISSEDAEKAILDSMNNSDTVKSQLEIQKEQMPKMLEIIKANRECFEDVDNKSDAEDCVEEIEKLAKKLDMEDFYSEDADEEEDFEWNQDEKEELLLEMDEAITQMEKMLPCIEEAEVMTDMMKCSIGE